MCFQSTGGKTRGFLHALFDPEGPVEAGELAGEAGRMGAGGNRGREQVDLLRGKFGLGWERANAATKS